MANQVLKDATGRKIGEIRTSGSNQTIHDATGRKKGRIQTRFKFHTRLHRKEDWYRELVDFFTLKPVIQKSSNQACASQEKLKKAGL